MLLRYYVYLCNYKTCYIICLKSLVNGLIKTQKQQTLDIHNFIGLPSNPHQTQCTFDYVHIASGNCQKFFFRTMFKIVITHLTF